MNMKKSERTLEARFYFYDAVINPERLVQRYAEKNPSPNPRFVTNAFGVLVDPKFCPELLEGHQGSVEPLPIPSNWHADVAEFGAALRAVDLAKDSFSMIELGCGWGCWMNNTGIAARKKHLKVKLIGVEGDEGHVNFAKESLSANGFSSDEYILHRGIAASSAGIALFPVQEKSGESWGLEPIFDLDDAQSQTLLKTGKYAALEQLALEDIARDLDRVDLLHVDIQGGEAKLIPSAISFLSEKVAYLFIGTHSRQIEGLMFDCLLKAGWVLEIERPAILSAGPTPGLVVDGVQGWRNPRLLPTVDVADTQGSLRLIGGTHGMHTDESFSVRVKISNQSSTDWQSIGHNPVRATYRWLNSDGAIAVPEGIRTDLADEIICSGETKEQDIKIVAPPLPGSYKLDLTLVQEGTQWFSATDFRRDLVNMTIAPRRAI